MNDIEQEYLNGDIFNDITPTDRLIKKIIRDKLTTTERIVLLRYADCCSMRDLGKMLNVSTSTAFNEIKRIREKIQEHL